MSNRQARIARKQAQRAGLDVYIHDGPTERSRSSRRDLARREVRHPDQYDVRSKA